jgi:hypothetical protein
VEHELRDADGDGDRPKLKMKNRILIAVLTMLCFAAQALTPFSLVTLNPDGTTNFNMVTFAPYPPGQPFYVYGSNIISGATVVNLLPPASGIISNNLEPITYTVVYSNSPSVGFFVKVLDTTNYLPLTTYVTTLPVVAASYGNSFGFITNQLGYWPATNGIAGMLAALGFQPATNSFGCITNLLGGAPAIANFASVIAALGYTPPTNNYTGLINVLGFSPATNGGPVSVSQLPYTPATNSFTGITSALGFNPSTNAPTRLTSSNPTNSYVTGTLYTNGSYKSFLTGYATGGILNYTNNGTAYVLPLTNDFCVPLTTNSTFSITGGSVTNVVNWQ